MYNAVPCGRLPGYIIVLFCRLTRFPKQGVATFIPPVEMFTDGIKNCDRLIITTSDMQGIVGRAFAKHIACSRKRDDNEG